MTGKVLTVIGFLVFGLAFLAAVSVPGAWILMLLLGAFAHVSGFWAAALSFWSCYIIVVIISIFFGGASKASS